METDLPLQKGKKVVIDISSLNQSGDGVGRYIFAALLLRGYIDKHAQPYEEALDALRFNRELLSLVDDSMSTKMTKQR